MRSVVMLYRVQLLLKAEQINGSLNRLIKFDLWCEIRSWQILLQKSEVASVRIFGETLKREAIDDSDDGDNKARKLPIRDIRYTVAFGGEADVLRTSQISRE
jgi:hypothetical protein